MLYVVFDEVWSLSFRCGGYTDVERDGQMHAKPKIDRIGQHCGLGWHFSCKNVVVVRWMEVLRGVDVYCVLGPQPPLWWLCGPRMV